RTCMLNGALDLGSRDAEDSNHLRAPGAEQLRYESFHRWNSNPAASPETPLAALPAGLNETVTRRGFCTPHASDSTPFSSNCCGSGTSRIAVLPSSSLTFRRTCLPTQSTRTRFPLIFCAPASSNQSTVFFASSAESG